MFLVLFGADISCKNYISNWFLAEIKFNTAVIGRMYFQDPYFFILFYWNNIQLVWIAFLLQNTSCLSIESGLLNWAMNRTQLFLNHSLPVICRVFKLSDNHNDLSISFHLIWSRPHFRSHRWLHLFFQIYNRDFNARHQFHCQLEFCLAMEFSKLNILTAVSLGGAHRARRPEREGTRAYFTVPTLRNLFQAYLARPKLATAS